ncbi:MAG: alginate lyase family protein [Lewinella sp.]|uniref:alginate lyase family protein n=1 Tax=Lewinella sp. TaxID=2004506 RepID=UPI003D6B0D4F
MARSKKQYKSSTWFLRNRKDHRKNKTFGLLILMIGLCLPNCTNQEKEVELPFNDKAIVAQADEYLDEAPITITAFPAERSAGGVNDYFSEGSYWWPDPENPDGPYIRKDGQRNPNNFGAHKKALKQMVEWVTTLTAAYQITADEKYAQQAIRHLTAWFVAPVTRMNPNLLYGQAIHGISTGRGIGIIDTLGLINVSLSIRLLVAAGKLGGENYTAIQQWFSDYGDWLTTHPYGIEERDNNNNHSTWWGAQVAAYALVAQREDLLVISREQFKKQLDLQMAADGSFPDELGRTKPFHYTSYNLRGWTTFCQLASTAEENLWTYESKNGNLKKALEFVLPYLETPASWPYLTHLETSLHVSRNDYLVFAYWSSGEEKYLDFWHQLPQGEDDHHANLVLWQNKTLNE